MSLQVLPEPSCWKSVASVIIKETLFAIFSSRSYHVRVKASGKALFHALIHLPRVARFTFWVSNDGLSREAFGRAVGAPRCSWGSPWHGPEEPCRRPRAATWARRSRVPSPLPSTSLHSAVLPLEYCNSEQEGERAPFLVLLLFVLLLVCLCVMFLLIEDGIFFFFFLKRRQGSKLRLFA